MWQLSSAGQQAIRDLAQRQGFSTDAVLSMLQSVINGRGSMAQFSYEAAFIFAPLRLKGATGSPGNPIAVR